VGLSRDNEWIQVYEIWLDDYMYTYDYNYYTYTYDYNKAAKLIKPPSSDLSWFATSCRSKNLPFDVKIEEGAALAYFSRSLKLLASFSRSLKLLASFSRHQKPWHPSPEIKRPGILFQIVLVLGIQLQRLKGKVFFVSAVFASLVFCCPWLGSIYNPVTGQHWIFCIYID